MARVEDLHSVRMREFIFQWKIVNFYMFGGHPGKELASSKFTVPSLDNSEWYLKLILNDINSAKCFLSRTNIGPESIKISYSLSLESFFSVELQTFDKNSSSTVGGMIDMREFWRKEEKSLVKDVLIECRLWQNPNQFIRAQQFPTSPYPVFCSARTVIPCELRNLLFSVSNFWQQSIGEIATFRVDSAFNMLNFNSKLLKVSYTTLGMKFELIFLHPDLLMPHVMIYRIQLVDALKKKHFIINGRLIFQKPPANKITFLIPTSMLEKKNLFLPGDMMLLYCEFSISDNKAVSFIESTRYDSSDIQAISPVCGWGLCLEQKYNDHRFLFRLVAILVIILSVIPHLFTNDSL